MDYSRFKEVGIYIHIPFCKRKCKYCDFLSGPVDESGREAYVAQLELELQSLCRCMQEKGERIRTVYFGGGTPSILKGDQIGRLMKILCDQGDLSQGVSQGGRIPVETGDQRSRIPVETEVTLEMNPGTVDQEKLLQWKAAGINRLSMGMQSFQQGELELLGRIHTVEEGLEAFRMAREAGFQNISVDLMSGLPGQTLEAYRESLETLIALDPEHISSYSLIIEEGTPFYDLYQDYWTEEQEELDRTLYELTGKLLKEAGYHRYEISNYSKPGYESKHNSSYWQGIPYYGCGLGASSLIREGNQWYRTENEGDLDRYLQLNKEFMHRQLGTSAVCRRMDAAGFLQDAETNSLYQHVEGISRQAAMEEFMFLGLRMTGGIFKSEFTSRFSCDIHVVYGDVLEELAEDGLLVEDERRVYLTERGLDLSNYCFSKFIIDN